MLSFPIMDIQIQTQKPLERETWKQAEQNTHLFNMGSLNPSKIKRNPCLDFQMSFLVLPNVAGSPQGPPRRPSEATKRAENQAWVQKNAKIRFNNPKNRQS